ncbi:MULTISPECIES: ABC transporter ATP-binding protein [unclassified Frankia]|uniref:ABC transporter ATP-binding protein n=1 Tax=unclassified Frankia TaxID=2632575 RepID=UPI001F38D5CA|nr:MULTISPECIES: ABC transporter ATP-binding protein [unclassified Frankia]
MLPSQRSVPPTRVTRLHAQVVARLTGTGEAARSLAFFADQGRVVTALVGLSVIGSVAVAAGPFLLRHLIDRSLPTGRIEDLVAPVLLLCALLVFESAVLATRMALIARLGAVITVRMRQAVNARLQHLPFGFFPRSQQGEVMTVMSTDVVSAQYAISAIVQAVVCRVADIAVGLTVVFVLDWRLSLAVMVFAPATLLIMKAGRRRLAVLSQRQRELDGQLMAQVADTSSVSGALHVRLFDRADYECARFEEAGEALLAAAREQARLTSRVRLVVNLGIVVTMIVVVALGAWLVSTGRTTLGTVAALGGALLVSFGPLASAVELKSELSSAGASFRRIFALLDLPTDGEPAGSGHSGGLHTGSPPAGSRPVGGAPTARAVPREGTVARVGARGPEPAGPRTRAQALDLSLDDVWFSYDRATPDPDGAAPGRAAPGRAVPGQASEDEAWNLRGVTLRAAAGTTTAVVGASGAGKTTITYLASGIHRPQRGTVRLGGRDLAEMPAAELHALVGVVPQDPHLFHDTIAANLRYGRLDATDDELREALDAAHLSALLDRLPEGLATRVGARGYRLSGGERQRLAIARVLLQAPRVLVLDEATSALDTVSEAAVRAALDRLAIGRTCLVIAHRLSTVRDADRIYVMDHGQVVEEGTHGGLLADGGAYSRLYGAVGAG